MEIFPATYLGKCVITDPMKKEVIKMATRNITKFSLAPKNKKKKKLSIFSSSSLHEIDDYDYNDSLMMDVDLEIYPSFIAVKGNTNNNNNNGGGGYHNHKEILLKLFYDKISSCYILREDNKILSLVAMNEQYIPEVHCFLISTSDSVLKLINILSSAFNNLSSAMITEQDNNNPNGWKMVCPQRTTSIDNNGALINFS